MWYNVGDILYVPGNLTLGFLPGSFFFFFFMGRAGSDLCAYDFSIEEDYCTGGRVSDIDYHYKYVCTCAVVDINRCRFFFFLLSRCSVHAVELI